jgi:hypothetical protein
MIGRRLIWLVLMKILSIVGRTILIVCFLLVFLTIYEFGIFFARNVDKAAARAKVQLERECGRRDLDCSKFGEPILKDEDWCSYGFQFIHKDDHSIVHVLVQYLPVGTESWYR